MQNIGQNKKYWYNKNIKMEKNNELEKVGVKDRTCYYFDSLIKIEF